MCVKRPENMPQEAKLKVEGLKVGLFLWLDASFANYSLPDKMKLQISGNTGGSIYLILCTNVAKTQIPSN